MNILKLGNRFQINLSGIPEPVDIQEFELLVNPGELTYGDIIKDLETLHALDDIVFDSDLLDELVHNNKNQPIREKYDGTVQLYFLTKGLCLIDGNPVFDYIGLTQVRYYCGESPITSQGPNGNYLLNPWERDKSENKKYYFLTQTRT